MDIVFFFDTEIYFTQNHLLRNLYFLWYISWLCLVYKLNAVKNTYVQGEILCVYWLW